MFDIMFKHKTISFSTLKPSTPNTPVRSDRGNRHHPATSQMPTKQQQQPVVVSPIASRVHSTVNLPLSPPLDGRPCNTPAVVSPRKNIKKPKRPLTAYHIYFQIEREYIIQTMAGADVDKSIHDGKIFFNNVPKRYINIRLSPDWYFGPGKKRKRKHRKQHGKIGFLELSRVITSRWNQLDETDPDIKQFVSKLADQEMDEYKQELKEYRANITKNMIAPTIVFKGSSNMKSAPQPHEQVARKPKPQNQTMESQQRPPRTVSSPFSFCGVNPNEERFPPVPEADQHQNKIVHSFQQRTPTWGKPEPSDDFDYCISLLESNTKVLPEQHGRDFIAASPSFLDPKVILDCKSDEACLFDEPATKSRSTDDSSTPNFVDICDDDIWSLWKTTNCKQE